MGYPASAMNENSTADPRLRRLRRWNVVVGLILAVQAAAIALLTNDFSLPVTATFMTGPPGTPAELDTLFDVPLGWGVFAFLAISAAALLVIASPGVFEWYTRNLQQSRNYARWIEYAVSSSIMIVLIAMITGVSDIAALLAIFGVNACMILFGLLMEKYETPGKPELALVLVRDVRRHHPLDHHRDLRLEPRARQPRARPRSSTRSSPASSSSSTSSPSTCGCSTGRSAPGGTTSWARRSTSSSA